MLSSLFIAVIIILEVDYEKDVRNVKNYHAWLPGPHRNMWATSKSKWLGHWALHLIEIILFLLKQTLKTNLESRALWVSSRGNPMQYLFVPASVLILLFANTAHINRNQLLQRFYRLIVVLFSAELHLGQILNIARSSSPFCNAVSYFSHLFL